jgi:hypothetical protein
MMAPRMSLSVFFLAQPQNGKGVTARYLAHTLSRRRWSDQVIFLLHRASPFMAPFEKCGPIQGLSADWGRPEVVGPL